MRKLLVLIYIILGMMFLSACGLNQVESNIIQDNYKITAEYISKIYNDTIIDENIDKGFKDYGNEIGIVPVVFINGEQSGTIRLNNENQIDSISLKRLSKEQVNLILEDLNIKDTSKFEEALIEKRTYKTNFNNMNLELGTSTEYFTNTSVQKAPSNAEAEESVGIFNFTIEFQEPGKNFLEGKNTLDYLNTLVALIGVIIAGYYIIVNTIFTNIQLISPWPNDLMRLYHDFLSIDEIKKTTFYLTVLVLAFGTILGVLTSLFVAIVFILVYVLYVLYCEFKRKQRILTYQDGKNQPFYLHSRTDEVYFFRKEIHQDSFYQDDYTFDLKNMKIIKKETINKDLLQYKYHGPDCYVEYILINIRLTVGKIIYKFLCSIFNQGIGIFYRIKVHLNKT